MRYLIRLLKTARAYRKFYIYVWEHDSKGEKKHLWDKLEDLEHDLLFCAITKGKKQ